MPQEVPPYSSPRPEGAAHAGKELPVPQGCRVLGSREPGRTCRARGLLSQLQEEFVPECRQVPAGLEHTLHQGPRAPCPLQCLECKEQPHSLLSQGCIAWTCRRVGVEGRFGEGTQRCTLGGRCKPGEGQKEYNGNRGGKKGRVRMTGRVKGKQWSHKAKLSTLASQESSPLSS